MTIEETKSILNERLGRHFNVSLDNASVQHVYRALSLCVRDILIKNKQNNNKIISKNESKRVYYLCMEFLLGKSLKHNLANLRLDGIFSSLLEEYGFDAEKIYAVESDPGLGNGGLGRLAACYLDSLTSLRYPAMGFTLLYEYGLFKQKIVDNTQVEVPDYWMDSGDVWMVPRAEKSVKVRMGGHIKESWGQGTYSVEYVGPDIIEAVPYDFVISGDGENEASVLRLWRATAGKSFDINLFFDGDYGSVAKSSYAAEVLTKVLYPTDNHIQGKQLRLSQQYFLVSASLQNIFADHLSRYGSLDNIHEKAAIHINDTHPALAIPEMMRLLMDEYNYGWDDAWHKTTKTIAYTNHTVLSEALETWDIELVKGRLPRIYMIIEEINKRFCKSLEASGKAGFLNSVSILWGNRVRMANLCIIGSHTVNGVSELHSNILKETVFRDFFRIYPNKFTNVTNGIAHRRWLNKANPALAGFICELIGDGYYKNSAALEKLLKYSEEKEVLTRLGEIKLENKKAFSNFIFNETGVNINPYSRFDVHVKRIHEYKRQLLGVLKILHIYLELLDAPDADMSPQTFIFGGKAAESYYHAKRVISLIKHLQDEINSNPIVNQKISVVFLENYNVSLAERIIPATEVSEQISLAGKEASGTSNMKFMLNGAITLGTVDGANVEILEEVGADNAFMFGLHADEVGRAWSKGYSGTLAYSSDTRIRRIVDKLRNGIAGTSFADIAAYLVVGTGIVADPYMCLGDFDSYIGAARDVAVAYSDSLRWNKMSLVNVAKSGVFSADRSIDEYANRIWKLKKIK